MYTHTSFNLGRNRSHSHTCAGTTTYQREARNQPPSDSVSCTSRLAAEIPALAASSPADTARRKRRHSLSTRRRRPRGPLQDLRGRQPRDGGGRAARPLRQARHGREGLDRAGLGFAFVWLTDERDVADATALDGAEPAATRSRWPWPRARASAAAATATTTATTARRPPHHATTGGRRAGQGPRRHRVKITNLAPARTGATSRPPSAAATCPTPTRGSEGIVEFNSERIACAASRTLTHRVRGQRAGVEMTRR